VLVQDDVTAGPLAGAVVIGGGAASPPAGPDGVCEALVDGGEEQLWVAARGYVPKPVLSPVATAAPIRISLARSTQLDVSISRAAGAPAGQVRLLLAATEGPAWDDRESAVIRAARFVTSAPSDRRRAIELEPDARDRFVIPALRAGVDYRVEAIGLLGETLAACEVRLAAGEWRAVRLAVDRAPATLHAVVPDEDGRPIQGALFALLGPTGSRLVLETRAGGRVHVDGLWTASVPVVVTKDGLAAVHEPALALGTEDVPTPVRLRPGRPVEVDVRHDDGTPAAIRAIHATIAGHPIAEAVRAGSSRFRFERLPSGPVVVRAGITGATAETTAAPGAAHVTLTVPRTGAIRVKTANHGAGLLRLRMRASKGGPDLLLDAPRESEVAIDDVAAGDYFLVLDRKASWAAPWAETGPPVAVRVDPGRTVDLRL
jgi:hypothetical protein